MAQTKDPSNGGPSPNGKARIVATYDYLDERGTLLFQVVRLEPKDFRQRRPDGKGGWTWSLGDVRRVLYRLPELVASAADGRPVFVAEGEKDADNLVKLGLVATTCAMGAGKWRPEYSEALRGRQVVILPDNDDAGRKHAMAVAVALDGIAAWVKIVELPGLGPKGDVSDWLATGGTKEELLKLALRGDAWEAPGDRADPRREPDPTGGLATTCLATIRPVPVRWLVRDHLPLGKLVLVAGDGGHGKSTLTLDLAACLTTGRPCLGLEHDPLPPSDVLLISCEDDYADTVVPRLLSAGGDLGRVWRVDGIKGKDGKTAPFCLAHFEAMEAELKAHPEIRLVVIDPAGAYVGRSGVDDYNDSELRSLLGPMAELAARRQVTILLVKHLVKGATAKAVHKVGGSAGYVNTVRAAFVVMPDGEDPDKKLLLPLKFNLGPRPSGLAYRMHSLDDVEQGKVLDAYGQHLDVADRDRLARQLFRIEWEGPVNTTADDVMAAAARQERGAGKVDQAAEWLEQFLAEHAYPSAEVFAAGEAAGYSRDNLYRARRAKLAQKIRANNKGRFGGVWYWGPGDPASWVIRPTANNPNNANNGPDTGKNALVSPVLGNVGNVGNGDAEVL